MSGTPFTNILISWRSTNTWDGMCPGRESQRTPNGNMVYQKPVFISEFGGEAKFGNQTGAPDEANSWREEYQEQIYKDQISMFRTMPNLAGVCAGS